jgi:thiol-disulfide isomerase/thioredoxin
MHELFSSSTCGPCKYGNEIMKTILDQNEGKYACVKYQMNWPGTGDPYYTLEGKDRRNYYGVNSVPYLAVDGIYYNGNPSTYTSNLLNSEYEEPAFIDFHKVYKKIGEQKIYVKITVIPLRNISGNNKLLCGSC